MIYTYTCDKDEHQKRSNDHRSVRLSVKLLVEKNVDCMDMKDQKNAIEQGLEPQGYEIGTIERKIIGHAETRGKLCA